MFIHDGDVKRALHDLSSTHYTLISTIDSMKTIGERIKELREAKGMSQADLGRLCGVSRAAVSQWERQKTKSLNQDNLKPVARALGITLDELLTGKKVLEPSPGSNVNYGPVIRGSVPLISWVQAGNYMEAIDLLQPGEAYESIDTTIQVNEHTYALRVEGDSMEPEFMEGAIIIVEPDMNATPGDFVIARTPSGETTLKRLIQNGTVLYLKPLNPRYEIFPLDDSEIIGVVRGQEKRYR